MGKNTILTSNFRLPTYVTNITLRAKSRGAIVLGQVLILSYSWKNKISNRRKMS